MNQGPSRIASCASRWRPVQMAIKRGFDLSLAGLLLVAGSPVIALIACAVLIAMGRPVLFRQARLGKDGRPFVLYKFRTMRDEVDDHGLLLPDGERLTRLGLLLRRTSLDELPELFNVVRGEMSIVGPRPLLPEYRDRYSPEQWRRHEMPPGLAGPVAAMGRNGLSWGEKFALDVWYVDNWSLWLDLKVLVLSAWKVLRMDGISAEGHATMPPFEGRRLGESEGRRAR